MVRIGALELAETELSRRKGIAVLNSSSPWASSAQDLQALYASPFTAAVTTRTAVVSEEDVRRLQGAESEQDKGASFQSVFAQDSGVHAHSFLKDALKTIEGGRLTVARGSLNSYGYSPHSLSSYLSWTSTLMKQDETEKKKPIILSITGPPEAIEATIVYLRRLAASVGGSTVYRYLGVEINLSCPNIKGNDAPAGYDGVSIEGYVAAIQRAIADGDAALVPVGLKLPPYTYQAQFAALIRALSSVPSSTPSHPITFLTSTNTLGSSFWLNEGERGELVKALPSRGDASSDSGYDGTGGLAGESLHPISLGNVYKLSNLLQAASDSRLHAISVIGVGGVMSGLSAQRMKAAGATAVGLATALGREGIDVFARISYEILDDDDDDDDE